MYKKILLALELEPDSDRYPLKKAHDLSDKLGADLTLLHVVEPVSGFGSAYSVPASVEVEQKLLDQAHRKLAKFAAVYDIQPEQCEIVNGGLRPAILAAVDRLEADLLVVGSYGRHGMEVLLGSTADTALHHAKCDILAVRIEDKTLDEA